MGSPGPVPLHGGRRLKRKRGAKADLKTKASPRRGLVTFDERPQEGRRPGVNPSLNMSSNDPRVRAGKIAKKVRLFDRANTQVCLLDREKALELIQRNEVEVLGPRRKVRAVRWISQQAELDNGHLVVIRKRSLGDPHRRETETNPRGVWTFNRIPRGLRRAFTRVIEDRMRRSEGS